MKKKFLGFLLAICMIIPSAFLLSACGGSGDGDNDKGSAELAYSYEASSNTYVVSGCEKTATEIVIPSQYKGDNGKLAVSAIDQEAFKDCNNLNSIQISSSVKTIGDAAFSGCDRLTKVNYWGTIDQWVEIDFVDVESNPTIYTGELYIKDKLVTEINFSRAIRVNNYAFVYNQNIINITIPNSVISIGSYAFYGCSGLTSITIGNNVTNIGEWAFVDCGKLIEIYNLSSLNIVAGSLDNGSVGLYAKDIYTSLYEKSKISESNGYLIYDKTTLLGYVGSDTNLILPDNIATIYQYAFYNCQDLNSIVIQNSVTNIESRAFAHCLGLTNVTLPSNVASIGSYAFFGCSGLTSITIGNNVMDIGEDAFSNCYKLIEIYNLSSLNIVAESRDNGYVGLYVKDIYTSLDEKSKISESNGYLIYDKTTLLGYVGSDTNLILPDNIATIYQYAFYNCQDLNSIVVSSDVSNIGNHAFSNCTELTNVSIPDSVVKIGINAFAGSCNLFRVNYLGTIDQWVEIDFENSNSNPTAYAMKLYIKEELVTDIHLSTATKVNSYAFINNQEIRSVEIGNGVKTDIGNSMFSGCSKLYRVILGDCITKIGSSAFSDCVELTSILLGSGITTIQSGAFKGCTSLKNIAIPDSVTSIGFYAFQNCSGLVGVEFGNGITTIQSSVFKGCTSLKNITIPDSVTTLQYSAFMDCANLNSIIIGSGITNLYGSAFSNCTNLRVVYYKGSVNDWNKINKKTMDNLKNASIFYYSETEPTDTTDFYWHYHTDGKTPIVWKNF